MNHLAVVPVRRPIATAAVFLVATLLGVVACWRLPIELLPRIGGDRLVVRFTRPGSDPEVVEREILRRLERRVATLPGIAETSGEVTGSSGVFRVGFDAGGSAVRELEVTAIAAEVARRQPAGTRIETYRFDPGAASGFAMLLHVVSDLDPDVLYEIVAERVEPRLAPLPGVARTVIAGRARREASVVLDLHRSAAVQLPIGRVLASVAAATEPARIVGTSEAGERLSLVVVEPGAAETAELPGLPVAHDPLRQLRHVAAVEIENAPDQTLFRRNGRPSLGIVVFQDSESNLIQLSRALRREVETIRAELRPLGIDLEIGFDGGDLLADQLRRLVGLGLLGLLSACLVLFLFLRRWRAVAIVVLPVPVTLAVALCGFHLLGLSLNLLTLFGLAIAIGMLVDNGLVVFEAVERRLERGDTPAEAAVAGTRSTGRALLAASATTAVVFLPAAVVDIESTLLRSLLHLVGLAIVIPLGSSLLVAMSLVPLLTSRLLGPRRGPQKARRGDAWVQLARELFRAAVIAVLRRPERLLMSTAAAVIATVVVAGGVLALRSSNPETRRAETLRLEVRLQSGSLETARGTFARLERVLLDGPGVAGVESFAHAEGGSLTIRFDGDGAGPEARPAAVLARLRRAASALPGVEVLTAAEAGEADGAELDPLLTRPAPQVLVSGPDPAVLADLAEDVRRRLEALPEVAESWLPARRGPPEIHVTPRTAVLREQGLFAEQLFQSFGVIGREGISLRHPIELPSDERAPLRVRRHGSEGAGLREIAELPVVVEGAVRPLGSLAELRVEPPAPPIRHRDERPELAVSYRLDRGTPVSGRAAETVDARVEAALGPLRVPDGYTIEREASRAEADLGRFVLPVLLLLFWILAVAFESLTLPVLVLATVPLAVLGSTWGLVISGLALDPMALVGALALVGLTVNPAILLVDRAQRLVMEAGWKPGAAALAAAGERARPMVMTSATTIAGLWPLILGLDREGEIWPPFAVVVTGGLLTCTLLGLFIVPVAFVLLHRLEATVDRFGRWSIVACAAIGTATAAGLTAAGWLSSLRWQAIVVVLLTAALVGLVVAFRGAAVARPPGGRVPPVLEVRALHKVYGLEGLVSRAWRRYRPGPWRGGRVPPPRRRSPRGGDRVHAVRGVSFRIDRGMVGLLGPNGAGKTTLLRLVNGILRPSAGRVLLGELSIDEIGGGSGRWLGYLPQENHLPPRMSPREYLRWFAVLFRLPADERAARVDAVLAQVGLEASAERPIGELSGGMRQRVAVARALLHQPPIVVVDEPTVGLDPAERIRLRQMLTELSRSRIVLLSTHVVEDVAASCERVLVIARGRLAFDGPTARLAEAAAGTVWEVDLAAGEAAAGEGEGHVTSRQPTADGGVRLRIVHAERPHPSARPAAPTLEEGYLAVIGGEGAAG